MSPFKSVLAKLLLLWKILDQRQQCFFPPSYNFRFSFTYNSTNHDQPKPTCAFLAQNQGWDTEGCETVESSGSELTTTKTKGSKTTKRMWVECSCNHLTSFSILLDVSQGPAAVSQSHIDALDIITKIGEPPWALSILCLWVMTEFIQLQWKYNARSRKISSNPPCSFYCEYNRGEWNGKC